MRSERGGCMTQKTKSRPARHSPARPFLLRFWLAARDGSCSVEILTVDCGGDKALPVFSHEEEAELFLDLGGAGDGWRTRESSAGEIVSLLFGPLAAARSVALDPWPVMAPETVDLVTLGRDRFVNLFANPGASMLSKGIAPEFGSGWLRCFERRRGRTLVGREEQAWEPGERTDDQRGL